MANIKELGSLVNLMRHLIAHSYLVALGSNQRHAHFGGPRAVVAAAMDILDETLGIDHASEEAAAS